MRTRTPRFTVYHSLNNKHSEHMTLQQPITEQQWGRYKTVSIHDA